MKIKLLSVFLLFSLFAIGQERREINLKTWEFSRDNRMWVQVCLFPRREQSAAGSGVWC